MAISKYKTTKGVVRYKATIWKDNRPVESLSFHRKYDADEWLKRQTVKCEDDRVGRLKGNSISLSEFFDEIYFPNAGVSEGTAKDYQRMFNTHLRPIFGDRKMGKISELEWANRFQSLKKKGMGLARLNRIHAVASATYSLGIKWRYLNFNPLTLVDWEKEKLSEAPEFWNDQELNQFLNWAKVHSSDVFEIYHFLYETGLRISEAIALQWDCVSLDDNFIDVRRRYCRIVKRVEPTTKSGHKRIFKINSTLGQSLLKRHNHKSSEFVFSKTDGTILAYETLRARFLKDQKESGVKVIGLHGLRHTFASHFVMNGGTIHELKALMGHSDVKTTERYAHLSKEHLANKASLVCFQHAPMADVVQLKPANHIPTIASENKKAPETEALKIGT